MLDIYLTDVQKNVQFNDYPGEHPVKFVLNFKKIFPSVMELLLPVLPENENLEEMTWESTTTDFELFKLLLSFTITNGFLFNSNAIAKIHV